MDWTMEEGYGIPIGTHCHMSYSKEVSLVSFTLHRSLYTRKPLYRRLQQAYARGALRLVKRIHALLALPEDMSGQEVAAMLGVGEQTVRDYRNGIVNLFVLISSGGNRRTRADQLRTTAALKQPSPYP
jgi:hypothetical protein